MKTFVFPGQGSIKKGMGEKLFNKYPEILKMADDVLHYSVKNLCLRDPDNLLQATEYTQSATYVLSVLSFLERKDKPDFVAGLSLGEYAALYAAGVYDFKTGLALVRKRGQLMDRKSSGAMAAVIGLEPEKIKNALSTDRFSILDYSLFNTPSMTILAGPASDIAKLEPWCKKEQLFYFPLHQLKGAFHSRYMQTVKEEFQEFISDMLFSPPEIPIISNVTARPYTTDSIKKNILDQFTEPVQWTASVNYLLDKGKMKFYELGPGNVTSLLISDIRAYKKMPLFIYKLRLRLLKTKLSRQLNKRYNIHDQKTSGLKGYNSRHFF
ncbi:MAG: ACP S-malonyltransferase [Desulfobacteraceae bacterium]